MKISELIQATNAKVFGNNDEILNVNLVALSVNIARLNNITKKLANKDIKLLLMKIRG